MQKRIKTKSVKEQHALISYLIALGVGWHKHTPKDPKLLEDILGKYPELHTPRDIALDTASYGISYFSMSASPDLIWPENAKEITEEALRAAPVSVILNTSHTAIVSKDGITVGCQTFPLSIVEALAQAVKAAQAS
jgi:hypothetical protein